MDLQQLLRRPALDLLAGRSQCLLASSQPTRRSESTYRRSKKKLNLKPASSFLSSPDSPREDHIIFNPPSSAQSVLHTPLKFLPRDDKRRQLFASTLATSQTATNLPPLLKPNGPGYQRHHLTEADAAEIRRLRTSNPDTWSRLRLAKKFNCSPLFVAICCEAPPEKKASEAARLEAIKARWGPTAKKAAADRAKRKELWYRDE